MTPSAIDRIMMQEALKLARQAAEKDEVPVGAVITHKNKIIAKAHNQVETLKDTTAQAQKLAITQATSTLSAKWLRDCTIYVTIEPCSMCAGALVLSRIKLLCFGVADEKTGGCGSVVNIVQNKKLNHCIEVKKGILAEECAQLMSDFFKKKREEN